jgi:hypothetical protein
MSMEVMVRAVGCEGISIVQQGESHSAPRRYGKRGEGRAFAALWCRVPLCGRGQSVRSIV